MASSSQHRCVFVGNIPYDASEEQLVQICEEVGPVVSFRSKSMILKSKNPTKAMLVLDRETGKPKGYGFCEYMDEETALSARRNLQGYEINGRQLRVDFAENDKGNDRNREQGRGGPGLTSNTDAQRTLSGPSALGNSASNQPLGIPLAANAASVMVGVLGGHQTMPTIHGIQNQPVPGNDPLTHYLAKMTKSQLQEIVSEMKALATQDKTLAQRVLQTNPLLSKALFQAEIILGMVTPQMLQMPHTQKPGNPMLQNQVSRDGQPISFPYNAQPPVLPNLSQVGAFSGSQGGQALIQPPLVPQEAPSQARFQFQQEIQPPVPLHGTALGQSAVPTAPRMQHATLSNVSRPPTVPVPSTRTPPVQPPPHQSKPNVVTDIGYNQLPIATSANTSIQQHVLLTPASPQNDPSNYPVNIRGLERANGLHSSITPSTEQILKRSSTLELARHPSKLIRLDDGGRSSHSLNSSTHMATSVPAQGFTPTLESGGQTVKVGGMQTPEKFLPPAEQALLDQVMSLTPEQLSSLPPDQRQQVIQLQQMLRS